MTTEVRRLGPADLASAPARVWPLADAANEGAMAFYRACGGVRSDADDVLWAFPPGGQIVSASGGNDRDP